MKPVPSEHLPIHETLSRVKTNTTQAPRAPAGCTHQVMMVVGSIDSAMTTSRRRRLHAHGLRRTSPNTAAAEGGLAGWLARGSQWRRARLGSSETVRGRAATRGKRDGRRTVATPRGWPKGSKHSEKCRSSRGGMNHCSDHEVCSPSHGPCGNHPAAALSIPP